MAKKEPTWVIDPHGHIVKQAPNTSLKDGWRPASRADIEAAEAVEAGRAAKEAEQAEADLQALRDACDAKAAAAGGPLKSE